MVSAELPPAESARWALLADPHISSSEEDRFGAFDPRVHLKTVLGQVMEGEFAAALFAGDLAWREGRASDYSFLKDLLTPAAGLTPLFLQLGNHDHRTRFLEEFAPEYAQTKEGVRRDNVIFVIEAPPLRWLLLDSLLETDVVPGLVGKNQRAWLENFLAQTDDRPTIVSVHHPPDDEDWNLLDSDRLLRLLEARHQVKLILYAHSHVYEYRELNGLHIVGLPPVGFPFQETDPVGWVEGHFTAEGAELIRHVVAGGKEAHGQVTRLTWR